jgi:hypothetical protein
MSAKTALISVGLKKKTRELSLVVEEYSTAYIRFVGRLPK